MNSSAIGGILSSTTFTLFSQHKPAPHNRSCHRAPPNVGLVTQLPLRLCIILICYFNDDTGGEECAPNHSGPPCNCIVCVTLVTPLFLLSRQHQNPFSSSRHIFCIIHLAAVSSPPQQAGAIAYMLFVFSFPELCESVREAVCGRWSPLRRRGGGLAIWRTGHILCPVGRSVLGPFGP